MIKNRLTTLKRRKDFLAATARGEKWITPSFIMLTMPAPPEQASQVVVGYTVTKKIGNAVERNRIRRRLKAASAECVSLAKPGHAYVLIARKAALHCGFDELKRDLQFAFRRIHAPRKAKPQSTHEVDGHEASG